MKNMIKFIPVLMAFMLFSSSNSTVSGWQKINSQNGVDVYFQEIDCDFYKQPDQTWYLLKFENTNPYPVDFTYHKLVWEGPECKTCDYEEEYTFTVSVPAKSSVEGKCEEGLTQALYVFSDFKDFELENPTNRFEISKISVVQTKKK
jgi:hypothetical protein